MSKIFNRLWKIYGKKLLVFIATYVYNLKIIATYVLCLIFYKATYAYTPIYSNLCGEQPIKLRSWQK